MTLPPKPESRPAKVSLWRYARLFRQDILSAQPARLYRAWMAEFKTPFFRSYLINQPDLIQTVLKTRPDEYPKSDRIGEGLRPLLGNSVFLTNGAIWKRQRRIIDPAFEGGRLRETFPAIWDAAEAAAARLAPYDGAPLEVEAQTSHAAADVIFRTLFSIPIEPHMAREVFDEFKTYQRSQPILNIAAFVPLPRWLPRLFRRDTKRSAAKIRQLITALTTERMEAIKAGTAPDDLAPKIMTTPDPEDGSTFTTGEMVDQVAIFFLAGHETSASALAWAMYLVATHSDWQDRLAEEAQAIDQCDFAVMGKLKQSRDVFREALRLYPPIIMVMRKVLKGFDHGGDHVPEGAMVFASPAASHRIPEVFKDPDRFDPDRFGPDRQEHKKHPMSFIAFGAGRHACLGEAFALLQLRAIWSTLLRNYDFELVEPVYEPDYTRMMVGPRQPCRARYRRRA